jgi:hypothetical protein
MDEAETKYEYGMFCTATQKVEWGKTTKEWTAGSQQQAKERIRLHENAPHWYCDGDVFLARRPEVGVEILADGWRDVSTTATETVIEIVP